MSAKRANTEIVGEFASRVLAVNLVVYSDCVERERVSEGRVRREVLQLRDIEGVRVERVASGVVTLVIEGRGGRGLRMEMMERTSAEQARDLVERLLASNGGRP